MPTLNVNQEGKERFLELQHGMQAGSQQDTLEILLDAAEAAISLADQLQCAPEELSVAVEKLLQQNQALQDELAKVKPPTYADNIEQEVAELIDRIIKHNEQVEAPEQRWMITQSVLKRLSTRNQAIIKRVIESAEMITRLERHHRKYQLQGMMANRGKNLDALKKALGR